MADAVYVAPVSSLVLPAFLDAPTVVRGRGAAARARRIVSLLQVKPTLARDVASLALEESSRSNERTGVLLLNLGGPDTIEQVEPFLYNLFSDPEIITLPSSLGWLNSPLAWIIARSRAPSSREGYAAIGGGSPQLATTLKQGEALEEALERRGLRNVKTYVGMRYWHPYTDEALAAIKRDAIDRLVVLPLYPQFSISTSGSSLRLLEKEFYADQELRQLKNVVIPAWYNRQGYVHSVARLVAQACDRFEETSTPHIFFSAHGLPTKYIEELGDPYQQQIEATVRFVMQRLLALGYSNNYTLAYQSRVGPVQWLQPYTDDKIRELADGGVESLVVVPISFVSEHIETLEEIDMEYAELASECGIKEWERVPALGLEEDFIDDLADAVVEALPRMEQRPLQEINEGRPVSLRVVNDLVDLSSKEELGIEYGPYRYKRSRFGLTPKAEVINGRLAMAAITLASLLSYSKGNLYNEVVAGRIPFGWW
uniref:Ferrochelatase n=2 Tax=Calcidiscus leptoporus TaxID=127549 RepID=A0A7S0JK38_9EUKA